MILTRGITKMGGDNPKKRGGGEILGTTHPDGLPLAKQ